MKLPISNSLRPQEPYREQLRIIPIENKNLLRQFIRVPWSIYNSDPAWVPPLLLERRQHLSRHNPFFAHAQWRAWLACRGSLPVGRISAQIDRLHLERYQDATGYFGMLEAEDNTETFQALLNTAENWLYEQGMRRVIGPFNLSINDECGLLVEGFDSPPPIMLGHARPYYAARVEDYGYGKAKDLFAYRIDPNFTPTRVMQALVRKVAGRVHLRPLNRSHLDEEMEVLRDIFNDAWSQNWGFVPFTEAEFEELGRNLKLLIKDDFVQIAEVDGEPAAMIVILPNINEVIRDLNGRLLPFGWLKLLWRLKVSYPKTARIPLMGVRKRYQQGPLGPALAFLVINALRAPGIKSGIQEVDMSWILEDNKAMRNIIESNGGVPYKRYRIYQKALP